MSAPATDHTTLTILEVSLVTQMTESLSRPMETSSHQFATRLVKMGIFVKFIPFVATMWMIGLKSIVQGGLYFSRLDHEKSICFQHHIA